MDTINAAGMDETYGTYVDDECFDIHDYDDDTDHDADDDADDDTDDDTNDDTDDDTDDGTREPVYYQGSCNGRAFTCIQSRFLREGRHWRTAAAR